MFGHSLGKRLAVHGAFLSLVGAVVVQGQAVTGLDNSSLLYALVSGDEVVEGPLDPAAYAQSDSPGMGGARLAAADAGLGVDIITFDDPEVGFAGVLGGNVVEAPLNPLEADPGNEATLPAPTSHQPKVYTVQDGDSIGSIADKFNISTDTVLWANGLSASTVINPGDHLAILPVSGVLHSVKSGDTVLGIAQQYGIQGADIVAYNQLADSSKLSLGQKLVIPGGEIAPARVPKTNVTDTKLAQEDDGPTPPPTASVGSGFLWPTTTRHISQYFRWGHTGIDIDNRARPAIYAADKGTVEFAGWLGGYGNLIILNHGNGLQTYYAHTDKMYVDRGQSVAKGAAIAKMGSTGRSTGPHLHFEVRRGGRPLNPMGMF